MRRSIRSIARLVRQLIGRLLLIAGVVYIGLFALIISGLGGLYLAQGSELTDHISGGGIIGPFVFGVILCVAGLLILEGKKRTVVFLRPFNSMANERTVKIFAKRLGGDFSLVALDDGAIPSPKTSAWQVLLALLVFFPSALVLLVVAAIVMPMSESPSIGDQIPASVAFASAGLCIATGWRALFPKPNKLSVNSAKELDIVARRVVGMSTWGLRMLIPRTLIVATSDGMWKDCVRRFCAISEVSILDVSRRSESIEWELAHLRAYRSDCVLLVTGTDDLETPSHDETFGNIERYAAGSERDKGFERRIRRRLNDILHF